MFQKKVCAVYTNNFKNFSKYENIFSVVVFSLQYQENIVLAKTDDNLC